MDTLRLIGFCLLAASLVAVLRPMHPQIAGLLCVAVSALAIGTLLPAVQAYTDEIQAFLSSLGLDAQYYRILLKSMGIVLVTQVCVQACQDLDAPSIARRAAFCGRMALLSVAVPVFMELTRMAVDVLQ